MVDEKNYSVVGINGFRRGGLTRQEAMSTARSMQRQMNQAGWAGKVYVYYRDGTSVTVEAK